MPIEPAADSLITVEQYLAYIGAEDPSSSSIKRDHYQLLINMVSTRVQQYCGRLFRAVVDCAEIFTGDNTPEYYVRNRPLTSTAATIVIAYWNGSTQTWTEATTTSYPRTVIADKGLVYFNDGITFYRSMGNMGWRVTYDYGWALGAVDADLAMAVCQLVQRAALKSGNKMEGMSSRTIEDETQAFDLSRWPDDVKATLARFRRPSCG